MRLETGLVERVFQRHVALGREPWEIQMADGVFTAVDIAGGPVNASALRSDGRILSWAYPDEDYVLETDEKECIVTLVAASAHDPAFLEALPPRPPTGLDCANCEGFGRLSFAGRPRFLICRTCSGLGWVAS